MSITTSIKSTFLLALALAGGLALSSHAADPADTPDSAAWQAHKAAIAEAPALLRYYTFEEGYGDGVRNDAPSEPGRMALSGGPLGSLYLLQNTPYGLSRRSYMYQPAEYPSPTWTQGRWPGKSALTNGLEQRCAFRTGFNGDGLKAFTLDLWVRFHGGTEDGGCDVLDLGNGSSTGFSLDYVRRGNGGYSAANFRFVVDGKPVSLNVDSITAGVWHNLVLVNTGDSIVAYLDGKPAASAPYSGEFTVPKAKEVHDAYLMAPYLESRDRGFLRIGGRSTTRSGTLRFDMGELAIYGRALDAAEIARNYASGNPPTPPAAQLAAFEALQARTALLDQITMSMPSDTWGYFVQGVPIPATITMPPAAAEALGADKLTGIFELRDLDGTLIWTRDEPLSLDPATGLLRSGETVQPPKHGIFFLDMWVQDAAGTLIKRAPEPFTLGICVDPPEGKEATKRIPLGRLANINPWAQSMPIYRQFAYPKFGDAEVVNDAAARLRQNIQERLDMDPDTRPFVCLQFPWPKKMTPEMEADLTAFFTATAEAVKDQVWAWELSNEPNGKVSPEVYMEMVKIASPILRRITPGVPIVGPGASPSGLPFIKQTLQMGMEDYIDIVSFHNYVASPIYTYYWKNTGEILKGIIKETCKRQLPIWNSESGIMQLPRIGTRPMTWDEGVRSGFKATNLPRERAAFTGYIPTLPEESAAARQVQGMLLDLASGFEAYIKCQSPETGGIEEVNFLATPTTMGVALTALAAVLSDVERYTPLPLASLREAGVLLENVDGTRDAVLFSELPVTLTFQVAPNAQVEGTDMLGNPLTWDVGANGVLSVAVDEFPVYLFKVGPTFKQLTPLALNLPEALPESGILEGTLTVTNPLATTLQATLTAEPIQGAKVELGSTTVELAPNATAEIPVRLTAQQLKRRAYSINVNMTSGDTLIGTASKMFDSPGVIVAVPELAQKPTLDGDLSKWEGVPALVCDDEDSVVHGKPNRAETWLPQWRGSDDLSFTVQLGWVRGDAVYFLLQVRDDHLMPAPEEEVGRAFTYDCLEFFFDGRKFGERGGPVSIGADQVVVVPQASEAIATCTQWFARKNKDQVGFDLTCVGRRTADGYLIEGKLVPKPDLDFKVLPGSQFAMDFLVDDTDDDEAHRKAAMALNGNFNNSTDSGSWGRYELVPKP